MATRFLPPADYLRQCFRYDSVSGNLFWRWRPYTHFKNELSWWKTNLKNAHNAAGTIALNYLKVGIDGTEYPVHRVVWKMVTGNEPYFFIDHINRQTRDNRFSNLREADVSQNAANSTGRKAHKYPKGVYPAKKGRWISQIAFRGVTYHLGTFDTIDEAAAAYSEAAPRVHGEFACTGEH